MTDPRLLLLICNGRSWLGSTKPHTVCTPVNVCAGTDACLQSTSVESLTHAMNFAAAQKSKDIAPEHATFDGSMLWFNNRLSVVSSTANRDPPARLSDVSKGSHCCRHVSVPALPPLPDVAVHRSAVAGLRRVHQPQPWQHRRVQGLVPVHMVKYIDRQENARCGGDYQHQSKANGCAATVDAFIDRLSASDDVL